MEEKYKINIVLLFIVPVSVYVFLLIDFTQ